MFENRPINVRLFGELMRAHNHLLQKSLNKYGIYRGQHFVLFYLLEHPGTTPSEMSSKFGVTKSSIGATITRMENNDLIVRKADKEDGRRYRLYITDKGEKIAKECQIQVSLVQDALFSKLNSDELTKVSEIFLKMIAGLEDAENTDE